MGYFYIGPLCGPLFAPIIGGALAERWGWRSTMWFMVIFGGIVWVLILFGLPETLAVRKSLILQSEPATETPLERSTSRVSSKVAQNSAKVLKALKVTLVDPLSIILYLRFIPIALTIYYAAITFGSLYVLNISIQETFGAAPYNFSTLILGLLYIPNSLGYLLASLFGGRWMDKIMHREAVKAGRFDEKGRPVYIPEDRMKENAWLGACIYPAALLMYGWTVEYHVHWIVPVENPHLFLNSCPELTIRIDDCELRLRSRIHANLRPRDNNAHRDSIPQIISRRSSQQLHSKYLLLRRNGSHVSNH